MSFRPLLTFLLFLFLPATSLYAQQETDKKTDRIINKAMANEEFPGMAVAVIQHNKVLFEKGFGFTTLQQKAAVDENTLFSIGSVSKAFTGIGVMLLVQQGKIVLDNPIKKYMKNIPKAWGEITIRQLMTHTSGIPEPKGEKDGDSFEQTVKNLGALPMAFPTGKKQQYNNFNFAILGKLIETVSGIPYIAYMKKYVFQPLQMDRTGVGTINDNVAPGHMFKNGQWKEIESHFRAGDYGVPSGGLQTTLADFIKLSQALSRNTLLNVKHTKAMWTPYSAKLSNTPGWHSRMAGRDIVIHKGGGGTGIGSVCDYKIVPSQELYVIVMANKANNKISPADITDEILLKCFNIPTDANGAGVGEGNEH
ncbi:serine hydrolase [Chitinophaga sp. CF418]|uniref:serine hydrolase domain-containing protein n=1 Tax=Chitinophaga sp. CF418 TaxID=1855287 RepID=UPI000919A530|nr:serine hydrolase domain-containing protein [Chitinophaga sp. CF418]SHN41122.1 CubicO group peptidase, beta-lactamase class C family [Chitinophaga sp. CF418]